MAKDFKKIPRIDLVVMMVTGDRLANSNLIENMKIYQGLCGGTAVWDNIVVVLPKQDYNPMVYDEEKDWKQHLNKMEANIRLMITEKFQT